MTTRRAFLKNFALAAPVAAAAPIYFFAPVGGWKSDVIMNPLTPRLAVELLKPLSFQLVFSVDTLVYVDDLRGSRTMQGLMCKEFARRNWRFRTERDRILFAGDRDAV